MLHNGRHAAENASAFTAENGSAWKRQWIVSKKRRRFKIQIDTSDLVIEFFCNFVIKPPGKIVIGSLDFSAFSGLVLGFGLFQIIP